MAIRPGQKPPARYEDPRFRLAFARIVTHYWRHKCWMDDVDLIGGALKLAAIPAVLVQDALTFPGRPMSPGSLVGRGAAPNSCYSTRPDTGQTSRA